MEPPSVPVSHYKSGVTQSAEDNRPPHLIKRHRLLLRVKAAIDFTLTHSLHQDSLPAHWPGGGVPDVTGAMQRGRRPAREDFTDVRASNNIQQKGFDYASCGEVKVYRKPRGQSELSPMSEASPQGKESYADPKVKNILLLFPQLSICLRGVGCSTDSDTSRWRARWER
ncbi:hypothetical protein FQN60_002808 [Etheostoma spectabile]|uniref:Uncharacterized protein n=1 Tax=Etheostoma spectabile TaxID=54343 RepID=A0A5J5CHM7_9PERO|nr:hypothetical protein FQN60_002808 [Etheostoma spectabile]